MIRIHKEGKVILSFILILLVAVVAVVFFLFSSHDKVFILSVISASIVFFCCLMFFRNPVRKFNIDSHMLLCPADGKVVVIEEVFEPEFFKEKRLQVSIFMSVHNVHVNRWPVNGVVKYYRHHKGRFHAAFLPKASTENERSTVVVASDSGKVLMIRQIAGAVARRIVTYAAEGMEARQGEDMGFIKFGSRVDLLLPLETELLIKQGDIVKGGMTHIAKW